MNKTADYETMAEVLAEHSSALLDSIQDGVIFFVDEIIVDCNAAAQAFFGLAREGIIGKKPWEISPEFQPDGSRSIDFGRRNLAEARQGKSVRFEWLHNTTDGRIIYADVVLTPIGSPDEPRSFAVVRDITEIRHAYEALAQREKYLAHSQEVARLGSYHITCAVNEDGQLDIRDLSASDQLYHLYQVNAGDDLPAKLFERVHPDDMHLLVESVQRLARDRARDTFEYRVVKPDGSTMIIQSVAEFIDVDDEGYISSFGTSIDVTKWVEANQRLRAALEEIEELKDKLQEENVLLRDEIRAAHGFERIIGESQTLRDVLAAVEQVAPTDVTVLVTGETGTGKELIAQSIHDLSHRKNEPMISVNCAALSADLIESELFGHEKGAFTGAHEQRKGRFELADGGTLFLDEIGEISGELQAKLLRVLQEGEFERLGGSATLRTDVRLITATNRDLQAEVDSGRFRADLFYRVNSIPIHVPALRERKSDIPLLAEFLVRKHAKKLHKEIESISRRTLRYLIAQDWPGNIRELEGVILRALISTSGPVLDYVDSTPRNNIAAARPTSVTGRSLMDTERDHIFEVLEQTHWVIEGKKGAAVLLGLAPSSLRSRMKRLGITRPE